MAIMQSLLVACLIVGLQESEAPEVREPDQFYTNGIETEKWTYDSINKRFYVYWFGKYNTGWAYSQKLLFNYDNGSEYVYYWDVETKKFEGRYSQKTGKYSLLPEKSRRAKLEEIRETDFPPPGDMPTLEQLLRKPNDTALGNRSRLGPPPPTVEYPRLQSSSWNTVYVLPSLKRIRATIVFDGERGEYRIPGEKIAGVLTQISYSDLGTEGFKIRGRWALNGEAGNFSFTIPKYDITLLYGVWTSPRLGKGTWDGTRIFP